MNNACGVMSKIIGYVGKERRKEKVIS